MQFSRPIEANGRFIGVAVDLGHAWRVVPVDPAVNALAESQYPSEADAVSAARQALFRPPVPPRSRQS